MKFSTIKQSLGAVFTAGLLTLSAPQSGLADELSVDYLQGEGDVQGVKLAYRRDSDYLHAYFPQLDLSFEASINVWEYGNPSRYDSNFVLAFSPVFRHTFYENQHGEVYGEFGIGVSLLDDTRFAGKDISTHFQFEDRLGLGYRFGQSRQYAVTLRYFHYSNGGLKSPNPGYDYISLSFSKRLQSGRKIGLYSRRFGCFFNNASRQDQCTINPTRTLMMTKFTLRRLVVAATLSLAAWAPFSSHAQQANIASEALAPDLTPNLTFNSVNGETFSLQQRWEQKPVLLYFWATWCPYCKKATPAVTALHNDYGDSIDVLGVNVAINDTQEKMHAYLHDYAMDFPVMFDESAELTSEFLVNGTPVFVVLSQHGEILYRSHRYPAGIEAVLSRNSF